MARRDEQEAGGSNDPITPSHDTPLFNTPPSIKHTPSDVTPSNKLFPVRYGICLLYPRLLRTGFAALSSSSSSAAAGTDDDLTTHPGSCRVELTTPIALAFITRCPHFEFFSSVMQYILSIQPIN